MDDNTRNNTAKAIDTFKKMYYFNNKKNIIKMMLVLT